MLETPRVSSSTTVYCSKNPRSDADDQQERSTIYFCIGKSSETIRHTPAKRGEDMVLRIRKRKAQFLVG